MRRSPGDRISGQTGEGVAIAGTDTFFAVEGGYSAHTIIVTWSGGELVKATNRLPCQAVLTITKTSSGWSRLEPGTPFR